MLQLRLLVRKLLKKWQSQDDFATNIVLDCHDFAFHGIRALQGSSVICHITGDLLHHYLLYL